jgi:hypothetical protein
MTRLLLPIVLLCGLLGAAAPAAAGSSVSFGISIGSPGYYHHKWYGHRHGYRHGYRHYRHGYYGHKRYYRHRHYYRPPAVVYVPAPPVYVRPAPPPPPAVCREYRGDATIDGSGRPFFGRACLLGDGRWHIVRVD